jgi:hypothetical protein
VCVYIYIYIYIYATVPQNSDVCNTYIHIYMKHIYVCYILSLLLYNTVYIYIHAYAYTYS